jgi:hypothetical protein
LITGLPSGLAALSSNFDDSLNVDIAGRLGWFHPDDIPEIAGISETDAGGFIHSQLGCVARGHPPPHIILAWQLLIHHSVEKDDSHWLSPFVDPPNFIACIDCCFACREVIPNNDVFDIPGPRHRGHALTTQYEK